MPDNDSGEEGFDFADRIALTLLELAQPNPRSGEGKDWLPTSHIVRLLVALSGGPDSTALLAALHSVSSRYGLELHAFHFNHGQRGNESDSDEEFCRHLCTKLQIPLTIDRLSRATAASTALSESDLRASRYAGFVKAAGELDIPFVVLGHTLDDQAETILFRLFRGTSAIGLGGMPSTRSLDDGVVLLRPMLDLRHADCLEFLSSRGIAACEDSSNKDTRFARNFLRHEVIPLIERRFGGFTERVEPLRRIMVDENELLDSLASQALESVEQYSPKSRDCRWSLEVISLLHPAVVRRVIALALRQRNVEVSFERVETIAAMCGHLHWRMSTSSPPAFSLNENWDVRVENSAALCWHLKNQAVGPIRDFEIVASVPGTTILPDLGLALVIEPCQTPHTDGFPRAQELHALVDLTRCSRPLVVRQRRPGDIITPFGMSGTVKLKKFLHTRKCNSELSDDVLLANAEEVLWVPGVGLSERLRVVDRATHRLSLIEMGASAEFR